MKNIFQSSWQLIRSLFFDGLLALIPFIFTIAIFRYTFSIIKRWLSPLYALEPALLKNIPHSEILIALVLILIIGAFVKFFLLGSLVNMIEKQLRKVPLLRQIYFGIKQLTQAFGPQDKLSFQKVVLIEFPRPGIYSIGFMTSEVSRAYTPQENIKYVGVFIPTTPNPTTGYYSIAPESACTVLNISRQDAMAIIISGGIIQPDMHRES
jgi:uncharacterized membrane protein